MHRIGLIIFASALVAVSATTVSAQGTPAGQGAPTMRDWLDRAYFNFNIGFETTSGTLNDSVTFPLYGESGLKSVEQNVDSGSFIDFSGGTRVWRNVSVGIGYHRGSNTSEASGTASVPNPIFFNTNRAAAVSASDLDRTEYAVHLQFGYMIPLSDVLSVHVTAGPSFFRLQQDVLSDMTFTEGGFPFSTVTATPVVVERKDSVTGVNAGVDVAYQFYDGGDYKIGAGVFLRYAGASARITVIENEVDSDVGGLQIGFGARFRF
jgi:outer membrane protein with beta-barrel domain